ncbi:MAG: NUDIX hydrolase [Patescibacteria group bacterium]|nr:NUDIX hydrolase [Patescibacteria group bacterium]
MQRGEGYGSISAIVLRSCGKDTVVLVLPDLKPRTEELPTKFTLPGGSIKKGESEKEALVREVEEETGLIISSEQCTRVIGFSKEFKKQETRHTFWFVKDTWKGVLRQTGRRGETGRPGWWSVNLALQKENGLHFSHKLALYHALKESGFAKDSKNIAYALREHEILLTSCPFIR